MRRIVPRFDTRALAYALAILLGWALDISGALHVYGLSALAGQQLAAATALLLASVAAGWVLVAAPSALLLPSRRGRGPQRLLTLLMLLAWLSTAYDFVAFLSPGLTPLRALA